MLFYRLDDLLEIVRFGSVDTVNIVSDESSRILFSVVSNDIDVTVVRAFIEKYGRSCIDNFHDFVVVKVVVCDECHSLSIRVI